jgi:TrmH family RNA methyltransferase
MQQASLNFIKKLQPLRTAKGRAEHSLFIAEGERFVREIGPEWQIKCYVVSESFAGDRDLTCLENRAPLYEAADKLFGKLSDTLTPQGVLAVCGMRAFTVESMIKPGCLLLLCEQLADPGNMGTLIRTADAAGADGVILSKGCVELYNPKVIRASAGSVFHLPCAAEVDAPECVRSLRARGIKTAAALPRAQELAYGADLRGPVCVMIGNEAHGLSDGLASLADLRVRLPMSRRTESLNAAAAGSILLYEAVRQRLA